ADDGGQAPPRGRRLPVARRRGTAWRSRRSDLPIPRASGEVDRTRNQSPANAQTAGPRFNEKKPEPADGVRPPHQEQRSHDVTSLLGNPTAFLLRSILLHEVSNNLRGQSLKLLIDAQLLSVQDALPMHHPTEIASSRRSNHTETSDAIRSSRSASSMTCVEPVTRR